MEMSLGQNDARKELTKKYPEEYRKYYSEEKAKELPKTPNSCYQHRAIKRLVDAHKTEYHAMYVKHRTSLQIQEMIRSSGSWVLDDE